MSRAADDEEEPDPRRVVRADQVGSLLRPPCLLDARARHASGELDDAALAALEDEVVLALLAKQEETGIDVVTDGEARRTSWVTEMAGAVEGFADVAREVLWRGPGGAVEASNAKVAAAPLRRHRRLAGKDAAFLARHVPPGRFKITLPAASNFFVMAWQDGVTSTAYRDRAAMMADVVAIVRSEIDELLREGVAYIQLDSPYYSVYLDEAGRARLAGMGIEPEEGLTEAIAYDNACLAGLPRGEAVIGVHICRGNSKGRWQAEGSYEPIAERLFGSLEVDRFLLEYDAERAGGFEPLRFLAPHALAVLGLVTTKTGALEDEEALVRRIEDASRYVELDRLALSPQCGFASIEAGNPLTEDEQWAKLDLVARVAERVWR